MSPHHPKHVSTPRVMGETLPPWDMSGHTIQGRDGSTCSRGTVYSAWGTGIKVPSMINYECESIPEDVNASGESSKFEMEDSESFRMEKNQTRDNMFYQTYASPSNYPEQNLESNGFNFQYSKPYTNENALSPDIKLNSYQGNNSWSTSVPRSEQFGVEEIKKKTDKSVTFHNEDLFNIYERDNSTSFDLCSPLPNNSPINPFTTSKSNSYSSQTSYLRNNSSSNSTSSPHSSDDVFKKPGKPISNANRSSGSKSNPPEGRHIHSSTFLDQDTASKLSSFSNRLKSLTTPTIPRTPLKQTPRGSMVTPRNKTPDSRHTTPRSTPKSCISSNPDPACFVSILEGRGSAKGEVGIAAICLTNPILILCQFSDSPTYPRTLTKLLSINPAQIITPDTGTSGVKLYDDLSIHLQMAEVVPVQRRYFNESKGIQAIKQLLLPELSSVELQFHNKFYCLAAANALIKYVEVTENFMFSRKSLRVEYQVAEQSTIIDPATAEHIELMNSLGQGKSKLSLFGVLNHCSTQGGVRLLRSNLFQPPIDEKVIIDRLEVVEELIGNTNLYHNLTSLISRFPDLDPVLTLCIKKPEVNISSAQIDAKIDRMVALKQVLELLPPLHQLLQGSSSNICKEASTMLSKHVSTSSLLLEMMHLVLIENANVTKGSGAIKFSRALAVKPDVNGLLDISRTTFCEYVEFLEVYVTELGVEHNMPLKLQWSNNKGFFIQISNSKTNQVSVKDLPESFQRVQKTKTGITFVTQEFSVKDRLVKNTLLEISHMSNAVLDELLTEVREYIGFLYKLSEALSTLDMLTSLATVSMAQDYVKPEFGDSLAIKQGRHPILDTMAVDIVANDVTADPLSRLHVLTGPNMSGKSTYLRQVVLLSIMAQIGCFVPAQFATFRIPDRIFSRVSNRDCIESNSSTFMVEMQETSFILSNLGPTSLIIIDELGRGTSVLEGASICWAICEKLLQSSAFVFLATHFMQMTSLADLHPCVSIHHFIAKTAADNQVEYTHQLAQGKPPPTNRNYGIDLASRTSLPSRLVEQARDISKKIQQDEVFAAKMEPLDKSCIDLVIKLKRLMRLGLTGKELATEMARMRKEFLEETSKLTEVTESAAANRTTNVDMVSHDVEMECSIVRNVIEEDKMDESNKPKGDVSMDVFSSRDKKTVPADASIEIEF